MVVRGFVDETLSPAKKVKDSDNMVTEYVRKTVINYGNRMKDIDYSRLVGALAKKGIFILSNLGCYASKEYGYNEVVIKEVTHNVTSPEHGIITSHRLECDADKIIDGFADIIDGIEKESVLTTTTKKEWTSPNGTRLVFPNCLLTGEEANLGLVGSPLGVDAHWTENLLQYETDKGDLTMKVNLPNDSEGLRLKFEAIWVLDSVVTKEEQEEMAKMLMPDIGTIQNMIEREIKKKKFGYDVEDVEIDCSLVCLNERSTACSPEIVKQMREARKGD
tara:strand:- start:591 stop:1418 length:828 start_codon:yes stop_codon:yes gene_type:complete